MIYAGELLKIGEKMKVRTQRQAQVYPGLFVYSGAWNAAASNIPLHNAQIFTSKEDLLHFHITTKDSRGKSRTYKFGARTQLDRAEWINALAQAKETYLYVRRTGDRQSSGGVTVGGKTSAASIRKWRKQLLSDELQPLDVILSVVVGGDEITVRDFDTLEAVARQLNAPKVYLRVVRFFGENLVPSSTDVSSGTIRGHLRNNSVTPLEYDDDAFAAPPSPETAARRTAKERGSEDPLHQLMSSDVLAVRLGYVPNISAQLAGKRIHHRWQERLGEGSAKLGSVTKQRNQSTSLNHFPTESIYAHSRTRIERLMQNSKNSEAVKKVVVTQTVVLNALQPVRDRVFERLVFRSSKFTGATPGVIDGSVLIAIGPVNVVGYSLERITELLEGQPVDDGAGHLFHFVSGTKFGDWLFEQEKMVQAATKGNLMLVRKLCEKWMPLSFFDVNKIYSYNGITLLYAATYFGRTNIIHYLLHLECSPRAVVNARNLSVKSDFAFGGNVLHAAALHIARSPPGPSLLDIFVRLLHHAPAIGAAARGSGAETAAVAEVLRHARRHLQGVVHPTVGATAAHIATAVAAQTCKDYGDAREFLFAELDNDAGTIRCRYTGRTRSGVGAGFTDWEDFNTEHTWPQSLGAGSEPARCDLHHLFITDAVTNSQRGSHPFGYVVTTTTSISGGSKLGTDSSGSTVFEPRDDHKGDVARALTYFAYRYGHTLSASELSLYQEWHGLDPVDAAEIARSMAIAEEQVLANPFVTCPSLLPAL